jgi:hypothetical protein
MPILASNFTSNSLQGTVVVSGGQANIQLPLSAFAFEGQKTFNVRLRKEGFAGIILASSNVITIPDTSSIVSLTANIATVAEGNAILYTLTTANVPNGTNVFFSTNSVVTANVNGNDFVGGNTGVITINNNVGTVTLVANADISNVSELAETFALQIRTNNTAGNVVVTSSNVLILDTSNTYAVNSLVESSNSIVTPSNITFTVSVSNIPAGTTLYYDTTGTATNSTFVGGNTGSFKINTANSGTNTAVLGNLTLGVGGSGSFALNIRRDSTTGTILATSNTIVISGLSAYYTMTGGNVTYSNQYKIHAFTSTGTLTVSALSGDVLNNSVDVLIVAGGGGGNYSRSGGAGAGGVLFGTTSSLSAIPYAVTVGAGGFGSGNGYTGAGPGSATQGSPSSLGPGIVANGGGYGSPGSGQGIPGGSGSGASNQASPNTGGSSTQSPAAGLTGYGNSGGAGQPGNNPPYASGGGGGAGGAGGSAVPGSGGNGGVGIAVPWAPNSYGTPGPTPGVQYFAGGGGGGTDDGGGQTGGAGGGARGSYGTSPTPSNQTSPGTVNTGGGGGGGNRQWFGSDGGSGIVLVRYPYTGYYSNLTANANYTLYGTSNVYFILTAQNANGAVLTYSTSGNVTSADFIGGNTGTAIVTGGTTIITLQANTSIPVGVTKNFSLNLANSSGNIVITSNNAVVLNNRPINLSVSGGTQSNVTLNGTSYRIHTFTTTANLTVNTLSDSNAYNQIEVMAIGGGAGGGGSDGGGGGAGGMLYGFANIFTVGNTVITVGGGGSPNYNSPGTDGANTTLQLAAGGTIIAYSGKNGSATGGPPGRFGCGGGGSGSTFNNPNPAANDYFTPGLQPSQSGLTGYATNGKQGNWPGSNPTGGGGGTGDGPSPSTPNSTFAQPGRDGRSLAISGSNVYYGGGGGSHSLGSVSPYNNGPGAGGLGGGGPSGGYGGGPNPAYDGQTNTGGGGGSWYMNAYANPSKNSSAGGSGVVIIRYLYN